MCQHMVFTRAFRRSLRPLVPPIARQTIASFCTSIARTSIYEHGSDGGMSPIGFAFRALSTTASEEGSSSFGNYPEYVSAHSPLSKLEKEVNKIGLDQKQTVANVWSEGSASERVPEGCGLCHEKLLSSQEVTNSSFPEPAASLIGGVPNLTAVNAALKHETSLQGQARDAYLWLVTRYPIVRRLWRVDPMPRVKAEDMEEESEFVAHFLMDSLDPEPVDWKDQLAFIKPLVICLFKEDVISYAPPFAGWVNSVSCTTGSKDTLIHQVPKKGFLDTSLLSSIIIQRKSANDLHLGYVKNSGKIDRVDIFMGCPGIPLSTLYEFGATQLGYHSLPPPRMMKRYFAKYDINLGKEAVTFSLSGVLEHGRLYNAIMDWIMEGIKTAKKERERDNYLALKKNFKKSAADMRIAGEAKHCGGCLLTRDYRFARTFGPRLWSMGATIYYVH